MKDRLAAGIGIVTGGSLAVAAWLLAYADGSGTASFALVSALLLVIVTVIGAASLRSAGVVLAGLAGEVVASFGLLGVAILIEPASATPAATNLVLLYWGSLALIGAGSVLWARRAAPAGDARTTVTASAAAFFSILVVFVGALAYVLATIED